MSNPVQRISLKSTQQNKTLGYFDVDALLSLVQGASILYDHKGGNVIRANQEFLNLTGINRQEIQKVKLNQLFKQNLEKEIELRDQFDSIILDVKRKPIRVKITIHHINDAEDLSVIKFIPDESNNVMKSPASWIEQMNHLIELSKLNDAPEIFTALEKAIDTARQYLDADIIAIYQAENDQPGLRKFLSTKSDIEFPEKLPYTDLKNLSKPALWLPGKPLKVDLHRFAQSINMGFLISTPLGQEKAKFGLLVAGSYNGKPGKFILKHIDILGVQVSNIYSHFILKTNLNKRLHDGNFLLSIRNILTENIREGIVILSPDLKVKEINPAAELMLGYTLSEISGQQVDNILIGADLLPQVYEAAKNGIITHDIGNVYLHHRSGQSFPAHIQVVPILVEENVQAILTIVSDMSEKEEIQLRTRQLEHRALLGEFASVFAHEVRNPINNISTGLQLLSSRFEQEDKNQEVIERTQNDCERLKHLMDSFLSFSRPIDTTSFGRVDINQLIQRVMDRWQPRYNRVNIKPYFQKAPQSPKVYGDAKSLERVFINLISNAVDVMSSEGGTLAVRVKLDNSIVNSPQIEITVSDTGPGIPEEIKNKIFEPFVTTKSQGTGLGLAITKHILTEHRGSICVKTFAGGTVFHVYLPAIIGA